MDTTLTLTESYTPDSQLTLIADDIKFHTPEFLIPPILHTGQIDFPNVINAKLASRVKRI